MIASHLALAAKYGIDFFILSWSLKDSFADLTLRKWFLPAMARTSIRHAVYLEVVAYEGRDVGDPAFRQRLADDLRFLGTEFLSHPSALRVDGRPVHRHALIGGQPEFGNNRAIEGQRKPNRSGSR